MRVCESLIIIQLSVKLDENDTSTSFDSSTEKLFLEQWDQVLSTEKLLIRSDKAIRKAWGDQSNM